jgi:hypothetical protein
MSDEPKILPWDPFVAGETDYPITTYQVSRLFFVSLPMRAHLAAHILRV